MLPGAVAYTYIGYAGHEAVAGGEGLIQKDLIALALLATSAFLPRLIGKLRERPVLDVEDLKRRLDAGEDLLVMDVRTAANFVGLAGTCRRRPKSGAGRAGGSLGRTGREPGAGHCHRLAD